MVFAFCHIQDIAPLKIHGNGDVVVSLAARFIHPDGIHCRKILMGSCRLDIVVKDLP